MYLVAVGELVMGYVSTPRIRIVWVMALLATPLAAISQAEAACSPSAPINNTIVTCTGATNGQNGTAGYGTNVDTGNTITVPPGASVTGTAVGVILQTGTVDNFGGIFGGISPAGGNGISGNIITIANSGTIAGGVTSGIGVNASTANVTNSGTISGGTTGINTVTGNVNNSGNVVGRTTGINAVTANVSNAGNINGASFGIVASATATVTNSGTIAASVPGVAGISANTANVTNSGSILAFQNGILSSLATVINSGTISGGLYGVNSSTASVTNSGSISGGTAGIRAAAAVVENSGLISGGLGIDATLASSIINSGTITGAGGTAISFLGAGNTLTLGPGSIINGTAHGFGADTFQLGGTGTDTFNVSLFATQYSGYATFNKIGPSAWTLTGTNATAMPWTVSAGRLSVNGALANSTMTVNAGGTLGGNGIVGSTAINGGTLAPGNSIGLLTVQGNLVFAAAASYMVEVSAANADRVNVTGTTTLGGATVNAVFLPGSFVNRQYTIFNAIGGVGGTFNPAVTSNMANIQPTLTYDANDVFLNIKLIFAPPPNGGFSVNQQNVVNALTNFFNATGSIPAAFAGLNAAGLTIASGELGAGVIQSSIKADDLFLNVLLDPMVAGRSGGLAAPAGGASRFADDDQTLAYAAKRKASPNERDAYALATKAPPPWSAQSVNRWSVWGASYGGSETIGGNTFVGSQDTRASVWGLVAGADYKVSPDTLLGFALAGGGNSFSLANGLGSGSGDVFQAGTFARHNFGPAYLSGALAYGWHDVTTNRTVALAGVDLLQGRFRADTFSGRFEGGYRFVTPIVGVTPYAAAQAISFNLPTYAEQTLAGAGTFALNYTAQTTNDTRTELGLRSDKSFVVQDAMLTLRGRAAWAHDYSPDRAVAAIFQALPSASFVVNGARPDADSALFSAGTEMKWLNGFSLAATFEGEFSGNVTSYAGKGVARYIW
jgi:uncharacterized protein with beta-barrel porin domain